MRRLLDQDLSGLSPRDLSIMRNEIFARHSYVFNDPVLKRYFLQQPWYTPRHRNSYSLLTEIEKANLARILSFEKPP